MRSQRLLRRLFTATIVLCLSASGPAWAEAEDDLAALLEKSVSNFKPVAAEELARARADVESRMNGVEQFVRPSSENGRKWLSFLRWDDLKKALAAEGATDPRPLTATYQRLNRDENGLELLPFKRLSSSLQRYIRLSQISQQPDQTKYFANQVERLKTQLNEYREKPTDAAAVEIGARLAFIEGLHESPELIKAFRREFVKPNAYMAISSSLIAQGADPIDRREPVTDCILGTSIRSDAHTTGAVAVATIPSDDKAVIEFTSEGRTYSKNVGNNGPAVIRSTAYTDFTATKRVELSDKAFVATPSRSHATTDTHIHSVAKRGGGLGSRLVSNIGMDRARQNERQAERIAADHAEVRIDRRFDEELNKKVRDARKEYEDEYRRPLERRGEVPHHIRFSSDKNSVNLEIAQASANQLAAPGAPPEKPAGHDMSMRLHNSAVNNYAASLLGGATGSQTKPDEDLKFDVKLPDWMKDAWKNRKTDADGEPAADAEFKPYSLRFRDNRPLSVDFVDGKVQVTIHISRLNSGDQSFTNWDVTGVYTPELVDGGVVLRRDGDLEMLPANFKGTLSSRQVAERSNLEKELNERSAQGRGFPKTIEFTALEPEGSLGKAGPLEFNQFSSDDGWLTVAWDRRKK